MSLHILPHQQYSSIAGLIAPNSCGAVYPLSVAEGVQDGVIYANEACTAALVHHCCGFAFLCGTADEALLQETAEKLLHPAPFDRMVLLTQDPTAEEYFTSQEQFIAERRLFYRLNRAAISAIIDEAVLISDDHLCRINGRITPAFSWTNPEQFLHNGFGFCVIENGEPAAWAFTAAVSHAEIDIGVETDARFRRRGFAHKAAAAAAAEILVRGKVPVWACHAENIASQQLAESLGFTRCGECTTIRKAR